MKDEVNNDILDLIMVFLYYAEDNTIKYKTRITQMVALFKKELNDKLELEIKQPISNYKESEFGQFYFIPYLYQKLSFLENLGYIESTKINPTEESEYTAFENKHYLDECFLGKVTNILHSSEYKFELQEQGIELVEKKVINKLDDEQKDLMKTFVEECNQTSLKSVMNYMKYKIKSK